MWRRVNTPTKRTPFTQTGTVSGIPFSMEKPFTLMLGPVEIHLLKDIKELAVEVISTDVSVVFIFLVDGTYNVYMMISGKAEYIVNAKTLECVFVEDHPHHPRVAICDKDQHSWFIAIKDQPGVINLSEIPLDITTRGLCDIIQTEHSDTIADHGSTIRLVNDDKKARYTLTSTAA